MFDHSTYLSAFTWRYASEDMRHIWSEEHRRRLMRKVWVSLAAAQESVGLVTAEQLQDLSEHEADIDIERAMEIERSVHHDVVAEIHLFAEQAPIGGPIVHWGATSADIVDNVDVLRQREALTLVLARLKDLLSAIAARIAETASIPVMALTHIQPAEPTTLGYRFAGYGQDLLQSYSQLHALHSTLRGKGLKGAVGTQASFVDMLAASGLSALELEAQVMDALELPYFSICTQTYPRLQDLLLAQALAALAATLHKFALDFRILQSPAIGEWSEPFGRRQVGSSAMPFKRNPVNTENICSLARLVAAVPQVMWDNASQAILERSLDDSANRRITLAESFLAVDEMLLRFSRLIRDMEINEAAIRRNMARYAPFAATERILWAAVAAGAGRQEVHEWLRESSMAAWQQLQDGGENPLPELLKSNESLGRFLTREQLADLLDVQSHTGTAAERAAALAGEIREILDPIEAAD